MDIPHLHPSNLLTWATLNDVSMFDIKVARTPVRGDFGLVAERRLSTEQATFDKPTLLTVPQDLVLNSEAVAQYARQDGNFRQLLDSLDERVGPGPF